MRILVTRHSRRSAAAPARHRARPAIVLAAVLLAQLVLVVPVAARPAPPDSPIAPLPPTAEVVPPAAEEAVSPPDLGVLPSVHYEDARAHAADRITFEPGGRVDVPFRPRSSDTFEVGGGRPRALPAGRATGAEMAASEQGSRWATLGQGPAREPQAPSETPAPDPSGPPAPSSAASPEPAATSAPPAEPAAPSIEPTPSEEPTAPVDAPAVDPADVEPAERTSALAPASGSLVAPAATNLFREVFGFLPYWELSDSSTTLDYNVISTIAYFSVGSDRNGNLLKKNSDGTTTTGWGGWTSSRLTNVINAAHQRGTRVVLTITMFAWTESQKTAQGALLGNPTARLNLARQAAAAVRDRGADGINLDFEPIATSYGDEFALLVKQVRAELDRIAPGYQLTFDTTGFIGNYPLEAATGPGAADAIFIMGYDYRGASSSPVGSIDPLGGPTYDITDTVKAYLNRVPASRLILGVPYYGRAWSTDTDQAHAKNLSGSKYGASATVVYANVLPYVSQHGRRWDSTDQSPYVVYRRQNCTTTYGCVTSWRQIWYDDAASLKLRYDLVNRYGLRGAGIWALGYDNSRTELNAALAQKFANDATPPRAGVKVLHTRQRDAGFLVTWLGSDATGIASWDVQVSVDGGPWAAWLTGTTKTSDVYLGQDGHGYAFRVRAKDTKGNLGAWDVTSTWRASNPLAVGGFATVNTDTLTMRAAASSSAASLGTLTRAQIVSVIGGPVSADGYTWWRVSGPLREWGAVTEVTTFWLAAGTSADPWLVGYRAPNSTTVDAVLRNLSVGDDGAAVDDRTFSPNGDGRRETIRLRWTNDVALDSLSLRVYRADGTLVGSKALDAGLLDAGAQELEWDGTVGGSRVADGTYVLALSAADAGATYFAPSSQPVTPVQVAAYGVTVDTVAPALTGSAIDVTRFSPNADGTKDTVTASARAGEVAGWGATVQPVAAGAPGTAIRTIAGPGTTPTWTWDGRTDAAALVADGTYRLSVWIADAAGNRATKSWDVVSDTRPAAVEADATPNRFSPNGDRHADSVKLGWEADEAVTGTARLVRGTTVARTWTVTAAGSLTWNGLDASGRAVPDGTWLLRFDVRDAAGNRTLHEAPVVVDRTARGLAWSPALFFPQDGDTLAGSSRVSFGLIRRATTSLRIYAQDGTYVKTAMSNRVLSAGTYGWTWNGRRADGTLVPRGWYRAVLTTTSWVGTTVTTRLVLVDAWSVRLSSATPSAGQTLTVDLWSAEPLAAAPKVTLRQAGMPAVLKTTTSVGNGRYRVSFSVAAAPGPATLSLYGRDRNGRVNSQVVSLTVQ
jgi:spore germination protein YaaH/flagellar hook assembly protein FlgD